MEDTALVLASENLYLIFKNSVMINLRQFSD